VRVELRVLDINVWHGHYARSWIRIEPLEPEGAREAREQALIEGIRILDPHVVTFQECFPQPAFADRVARALGYEHVSQVSNAGLRIFGAGYPLGVDTGEGSTILAKPGLGLRSLGRRALSGYGYTNHRVSFQFIDKRMALGCAVELGGKTVVIVTCHVRYDWASFDLFESAWRVLLERGVVEGEAPPELVRSVRNNIIRRDAEIDALAAWVEKVAPDEAPFVISGDLNVDDEAPQLVPFMKRIKAANVLVLANSPTRTWDPVRNPHIAPSASFTHPDGSPKDISGIVGAYHDQLQQRPDHIYIGGRIREELAAASVVLDEPIGGVLPSDHFGVLATIKL